MKARSSVVAPTKQSLNEKKLPLSECVDVLDAQRVPVNASDRSKRTGVIPYYGATGQVGTIDDFLFDEELVLLGEDGAPFLDKTKPIAYVIFGKSWVNNHAHVLRAKAGITANWYIKYFLDSFDFHDYVNGSTRLKLTQKSMNSIPVPLPPLEVQESIVEELNNMLPRVDAAREGLERAKVMLRKFRQSVIALACKGSLTKDWRQRLSANEEWESVTLGDVAEVRGGVTKGRKLSGIRTTLPYLRVANVQDGFLDLREMKEIEILKQEKEKYLLRNGDVLFTEGGDRDKLGRGAVWRGEMAECIHQNHIFRARPNTDLVTSDFLSLVTKGEEAREYFFRHAKQIVNLASINMTVLKSLPLSLPSIEEQNEIVRRVHKYFEIADRVEKQIDRIDRDCEKTSSSILQVSFQHEQS